MKVQINAEVLQSKSGQVVLKIFNGFGDPIVAFVEDSVDLMRDVPTAPSCDHEDRRPWPIPARVALGVVRFGVRCLLSLGYFCAAPIEASLEPSYSQYLKNRKRSWDSIWGNTCEI